MFPQWESREELLSASITSNGYYLSAQRPLRALPQAMYLEEHAVVIKISMQSWPRLMPTTPSALTCLCGRPRKGRSNMMFFFTWHYELQWGKWLLKGTSAKFSISATDTKIRHSPGYALLEIKKNFSHNKQTGKVYLKFDIRNNLLWNDSLNILSPETKKHRKVLRSY